MRRPPSTIVPWHERLFGPSPWGKRGSAGKATVILAALVLCACITVVFYAKQASARGMIFDDGVSALRAGNFPVAVSSLKQATEQDPANARAFYELGNAYDAQGQDPEAKAAWTEAMRLDSEMYEPYIARGIQYFNARDFEASLRDFDRAVQLHPSMESYLQLGLAQQALGQHRLAIDSFNEALARGGTGLKDRAIQAARKASVKAIEGASSN